jgi:serine phosphatase RsbU (regulator of sigma subunit)
LEPTAHWLFHAGDHPSFALPTLHDSAWLPLNPRLRLEDFDTLAVRINTPKKDTQTAYQALPPYQRLWSGAGSIGWFRLHCVIDSSLVGKPIGLLIRHYGASEVYVDGKCVFGIGTVSPEAARERRAWSRQPRIIVFSTAGNHCIAVRYSNHRIDHVLERGVSFEQFGGFVMIFANADALIENRLHIFRLYESQHSMILAITLTIGLLHFVLYVFYPKLELNLFYALGVWAYSMVIHFGYARWLSENPDFFVWARRLSNAFVPVLLLLLAVFVYKISQVRVTWRYWWLLGVGLLISTGIIFLPTSISHGQIFLGITTVLYVLVSAEMIYVTVNRLRQPEHPRYPGAWIAALGGCILLTVFVMGLLSRPLPRFASALGWIEEITGVEPITAAFLAFLMSVSIFLGYLFAHINRTLSERITEVEQLSARTLAQERRAAEQEIAQQLLEADNARKTLELEEARKLQLSLLPRTLPTYPAFEIAAAMETATEVGGDYYDCAEQSDGSLILALGDATGHGAKAGYFVATAKSYFQYLTQQKRENDDVTTANLVDMSARISSGLASMRLRGMFMAMTLVHLRHDEQERVVRASVLTAGMPPVLIVRAGRDAQEQRVEAVGQKAMPLGVLGVSFAGMQHTQTECTLHAGDVMVLMSDGFPERFNAQQQIYGYEQTVHFAATLRDGTAQNTLQALTAESASWAGAEPLNDDMTFVIVRVFPQNPTWTNA